MPLMTIPDGNVVRVFTAIRTTPMIYNLRGQFLYNRRQHFLIQLKRKFLPPIKIPTIKKLGPHLDNKSPLLNFPLEEIHIFLVS